MFNLSQNRFNTLKWQMILRHHPSAFLLVAQLISLALYAVVDENHGGRILLSAFGILVLALVAWVLVRSRKIRWITWVLVASALVMALLSVLIYAPFLVVVSSGLNALLYFSAAGTLTFT